MVVLDICRIVQIVWFIHRIHSLIETTPQVGGMEIIVRSDILWNLGLYHEQGMEKK
jgi:hypothetical protein